MSPPSPATLPAATAPRLTSLFLTTTASTPLLPPTRLSHQHSRSHQHQYTPSSPETDSFSSSSSPHSSSSIFSLTSTTTSTATDEALSTASIAPVLAEIKAEHDRTPMATAFAFPSTLASSSNGTARASHNRSRSGGAILPARTRNRSPAARPHQHHAHHPHHHHHHHMTHRSLSSTQPQSDDRSSWVDVEYLISTSHQGADGPPLATSTSSQAAHNLLRSTASTSTRNTAPVLSLLTRNTSSHLHRVPSSSSTSTSTRHSRRASLARNTATVPVASLLPPARTAIGLEPEQVVARLEEGRPLLVVDTRNLSAFLGEQGRLKDSLNVNFPSLLIKRFRRGNTANFSLSAFISTAAGIATFQSLAAAHGGAVDALDILVVDEEISGKKECTTGSVLISVLERRDEVGAIYFLRGAWEALSVVEGAQKWIVVGERDEAFELSPGGANLIQDTGAETTGSPSPSADPLSRLARAPATATDPILIPPTSIITSSPQQLSSASFTPPSPPRTPGGTRKMPRLNRLDTSDTSLRGFNSGTSTAASSAHPRRSGSLAPMSIQSLCHVQSRSPTWSARSEMHPPSHWATPLTPKTDLSTPPFEISTIIPGFLFLGPSPTLATHVKLLQEEKVKEVLNMALECEDVEARVEQAMSKYHKIGMRDFVEEIGVQKSIAEGCRILAAAELHSSPIYVHCYAGKSRSVTIVLAYLIYRNHWSLKRAFAYVLERRAGISPNIGFISELMKWEEQQRGERSHGVFGISSHFVSPPRSVTLPSISTVAGSGCASPSSQSDVPATSYFPQSKGATAPLLLATIMAAPTLARSTSGGASAGLSTTVYRKRDSLTCEPSGLATERQREVRGVDGAWVAARREAKGGDLLVVRRASRAGLESAPAAPSTSWG